MKFKESEKRELKRSTSEPKEVVVSIAAILNKHQGGEPYQKITDNSIPKSLMKERDQNYSVSRRARRGHRVFQIHLLP
jgi:hypothetical protein